MSDYVGMGRLTWFPRGPDPGKRCTSTHPQSAWGLQRPTPRTEPHRRCTWVGRQWLWTWLTAQALPCESGHAHPLGPHFWIPHLPQTAPEHTVLWVTVSWIRCSEIMIGNEATQQNSCEILMPLTSLRHRIHCESLISENHLRKIPLLPYWQREVSWRFGKRSSSDMGSVSSCYFRRNFGLLSSYCGPRSFHHLWLK